MNHQHYMTLRIINATLREDVSSLVSRGEIYRQNGEIWLCVKHLATPFRLQVRSSDYMQSWVAVAPCWQEQTGDDWQQRQGYARWLTLLMPDDNTETRQRYERYRQEADAACEQRELCCQAYQQQRDWLARPLAQRSWGERLRHADQMASYLDHPYYPTARAKFGFSIDQLCRYAPEFCSAFLLRWLALPASSLTLTSAGTPPAWWPTFLQVGLAHELRHSHVLIPIHPLTWQQLDELPPGAIAAPQPWLSVFATLSVRTVQLAEHPAMHIKLPLAMCTLGQQNIRLIKPSTLYDGQWFAEMLPRLAENDPLLEGRYRHVDESFCGHAGDDKKFAFLLRRYPAPRQGETLAPVAALGSSMPDGRSYLEFVLDQPGMPTPVEWWQQYCRLMSDVHLTLWLRYGIALESNQQNALISFTPGQPLSLMMKDNDAARLWPARFTAARPDLQHLVAELRDPRIRAEDERALAQMFITITLQLCLAAVLENLAGRGVFDRQWGYRVLSQALTDTLSQLEQQGVATAFARQTLFDSAFQPVKYLLLSGSLLSKQASGAADINKYYGQSGPNFLRQGVA